MEDFLNVRPLKDLSWYRNNEFLSIIIILNTFILQIAHFQSNKHFFFFSPPNYFLLFDIFENFFFHYFRGAVLKINVYEFTVCKT